MKIRTLKRRYFRHKGSCAQGHTRHAVKWFCRALAESLIVSLSHLTIQSPFL